jgi:2,3,4,5-tetrahydropyridine-2-carboxylate N-succinyltransferase
MLSEVIELLDTGKLRVAEPIERWMASKRMGKESSSDVLPYSKNGNSRSWYFEYHDKMLKRDYAEKGTCSSWCNCPLWLYISSV